MTRIFYFCPDFPQPSGGIKTLYRHVHCLCEIGYDAAIVHQKRDFILAWHGYTVPVIWLEDRPQFGPEDVWVLPEIMLDLMQKSQNFPVKRVVFALSWLPTYARLPIGARWQDYGIIQAIAKSPTIQRHLEWSMEIDVRLIPEFIDPALYTHQPEQKKPQVAYMTRKDRTGEWLQGVLTRKHPSLEQEYSWLVLREMDEATYAQNLRASSIYLATTLQEGMHVSILEALACGCLVIGYSGIGGSDYLVGSGDQQNAILVENGNLPLLGQTLEKVLLDWQKQPHLYDKIIQNGIGTARQYQNLESEAEGLKNFYEYFLDTDTAEHG